ncbi:hypothetical protein C7H09_16910 [Marinobacter fuscus]|uniref:Roadblock/LAMTOR2 domain-containing protein n=1 Tax=Marinobacter fuscus TaxID=2109942 RepID=A0A2T1K4S2_9GAMM|nr:roadblock/LC7 domain-containing protein [Marinobacter fuscus]PSF05028.1 hypothetical protein C7H09_16910 [Marinobacter fuscus]
MSTTCQDEIRSILRLLKTSTQSDIIGACVVSTDGYLMASQMSTEIDGDRFSSMCASLLALARQMLTEVDIGEMQQVMVMGSNGISVLTYAGQNSVLALTTSPKAIQGRVLMESKRAAREIRRILEGDE